MVCGERAKRGEIDQERVFFFPSMWKKDRKKVGEKLVRCLSTSTSSFFLPLLRVGFQQFDRRRGLQKKVLQIQRDDLSLAVSRSSSRGEEEEEEEERLFS